MNTGLNNNIRNETIKVCVRVRPMLLHEDLEFWVAEEEKNQISTINNPSYKYDMKDTIYSTTKEKDLKRILLDTIYMPQLFTFDRVYSQKSSSQIIYKELGKPITKSVLSGYNGTIFMYGQTTSGKTFTMLGNPDKPGILPCALRDIFNQIEKDDQNTYNVFCSYIEIYNENINDLLNSHSSTLKLVDDNRHGVIVADSKKIKIKNFDDGIILLNFGEENRKYRETQINEYSSRSHTIFQIFIESDTINNNNTIQSVRYSCLNLVDLAGSERLNDYDSRTEAQGETGYINKSLFVLANVINKLADSKNGYIPYRDSKITRLLSQALGGNSLTTIICTISPASQNYNQTLSTLRFATRAKTVKNKATVNEFQDDKVTIEEYKKEIKKLKEELIYKETEKEKEILQHIMKNNESLNLELENYKGKYIIEKERNDQMRHEMDNIKQSLASLQANRQLTNSQYSNNTPFNVTNNSNFISSKENFFPNSNSNLIAIPNRNNLNDNFISNLNDGNYSEANNLSLGENALKNGYKKSQINEINLNHNNYSNNIGLNLQLNGNTNSMLVEETYVENVLKKINQNYLLEGNKKNMWQEESQRANSEYKKEISILQKKYFEILKETSFKFFPNKNIENLIFKDNSIKEETRNQLDDAEEIIQNITNKSIFSETKLNFTPAKNENFESGIKRLRVIYEENSEKLEKNMDEIKIILENFYRKKIQNAKNFQLNSMDYPNSNLSIMNITTEHNEKLKQLRELYQEKLKNLEQSFFENLKSITTNFGKNFSK